MNFLVIIITFTTYFGRIQAFRREDDAFDDSGRVEPVAGTPSNSKPLLNSYKDESIYEYDRGNRYFYMADDFGIVHLVDSNEEVETEYLGSFWKNPTFKILLFTRTNRHIGQILEDGDELSLIQSNYVMGKNIVILTHGWRGNSSSPVIKTLTHAFLEIEDVNIIVFDWGELANKNYFTAKFGAVDVGRTLGQFIKWLTTSGYTMYHKIHIVGHSLGAHLAGNAGKETGGVVARITGLDPAGPFWRSNRLISTDALYVEVIHTNGGSSGYEKPCGDADFYPNGGKEMPGCGPNAWYDYIVHGLNMTVCSHSRSWEYMASSILYNRFEAKKCKDYYEMQKDKCDGPIALMGNNDLYKNGRGIFRLNTKATYPYF